MKQSKTRPSDAASRFAMPPAQRKEDGSLRRVGFELEFAGLSIDETSRAVAESLGAKRSRSTNAEHVVKDPELGEFAVEIDWNFLKDRARFEEQDEEAMDWTLALRALVRDLVPIEVVCPPVPITDLDQLHPVTEALRVAGAEGTESKPWAAFGVHINAEAPDLEPETLHRYLRAYCLLQWWLVDEHDIDMARRLSVYVDPYPEAYLHDIHTLREPSMDELIEQYLEYNPTRNRALDMLPLFAEIDETLVQNEVNDERVNARPTFHYRLPDCRIDDSTWTLARSWNRWCTVERLAHDPEALDELAAEFRLGKRGLLGVARKDWIANVDQWVVPSA